jgi:hypothetical protein
MEEAIAEACEAWTQVRTERPAFIRFFPLSFIDATIYPKIFRCAVGREVFYPSSFWGQEEGHALRIIASGHPDGHGPYAWRSKQYSLLESYKDWPSLAGRFE